MPEGQSVIQRHCEQIQLDKILLVHHNMPLMLAGNLLGSLPLTVVLWHGSRAKSALLWIGSIYVLTLVRWWHYRKLDVPNASRAQIRAQGRAYIGFAFVSGCIWGSGGILFLDPADTEQFIFLFLTLFAMTSGSMTSLSARPLNYLAYALPAILPITVNLFLQEDTFFSWMGLAALVYLSLTLLLSRNLYLSVDRAMHLKYENQDLLVELREQTEVAQQASREKTQFLAAASHDLRQPLHAVNLFIESLGSKLSNEAEHHDLHRIRLGLDSLGELLNALLNIAQMDSGSMPVNRVAFPLNPLLRKLVVQFAPLADAKGLRLEITPCGLCVHSDPVLLERMISNLLSNAIRYTDHGTVRVICQKEGINHLRIRVIDTGPGIPKVHTTEIFTEFVQLNNPERDRSKGLGLGLAIVRRLSERLDHPVELLTAPGKGAEFSVRVPISHDDVIPDDSREVEHGDRLQGLRVLVIDNERTILDAMKALLEGWQCRFMGAETADQAIRFVDGGLRPDFVIADYRLPGDMNGHALIEVLHEKIGPCPTLLISGDTGEQIVRKAKKAGLILLTKPVKPAQLRLAMTRLLNRRIG